MNDKSNLIENGNRRSFLKTALTAAGATAGTGLLVHGTKALAQSSSSLTAGDAAILRFLAAGRPSRSTSGRNITSLPEFRMAKFQAAAETGPTPVA